MLVGYINVTMKLYPIKKEHKTRQYVYRTAPHGGVIFALQIVKNTGIYSVL